MFANDSITSDYWRHHIPFAPDLEATVIVGKSVNISLKDHLIQGARDYVEGYSPEPSILPSLIPVQRGWLLDIIQTNDGVFGKAVLSDFKDGFKYTPIISSPSTQDCFNYQLSNGTQLSNFGKITVTVIKPVIPVWKIFATTLDVLQPNQASGEYAMSFDITVGHSSFFKSIAYKIVWHIVEPIAKLDPDGVTRVYYVDTPISLTSWNVSYDNKVTIINSGKSLPKRVYKRDSNVVGIDATTNAPFIPKNKFPDVYVTYINYPHKVVFPPYYHGFISEWDVSRPEAYTFKIEDLFGPAWNRSSQITSI